MSENEKRDRTTPPAQSATSPYTREAVEKVIKGLECCTEELGLNQHRDDFCAVCPYKDKDPENWYCFHRIDLMRDALALLKAQEPEETRLVRHFSRPNVYADLWLHCEKCNGRVDDRYRPKFCPECGRKVKWK